MARLRVPEQHTAALVKLLTLPDQAVNELVTLFEKTPLTVYQADRIYRLVTQVTSIAAKDARGIVELLLSLHAARLQTDRPLEEFLQLLVDATTESGKKELVAAIKDVERARSRLSRLLNLNSLAIASKAADILFENQHSLVGARIITDIRPVFGHDVKKAPLGGIIVHTLKVDYMESGERKQIYVAMDTNDVVMLKSILDRAEHKAKSLHAVLTKAAIPPLTAE